MAYFTELEQFPNCMETQRMQIATIILRKNKDGLSDFKLHYKVIVIRTAWHWPNPKQTYTDQETEQRARNEAQLIYNKGDKKCNGENIALSIKAAWKTEQLHEKQTRLLSHIIKKNKFKQD